METMNYYAHVKVTLQDIEAIAKEVGYRTQLYTRGSDHVLNVYFGDDRHMRWEWMDYKREDVCFEDDPRKRINELDPTSILLFEYYPYWLSDVVKFMTVVLKKYGGMLDCTGFVDQMYTLENLDGLVSGCP